MYLWQLEHRLTVIVEANEEGSSKKDGSVTLKSLLLLCSREVGTCCGDKLA